MPTDLATYLSFDGKCEEAFKYYASVLGGEILAMMRYADAPAEAGMRQTPETAGRIMHARLKVGDRVLMGADAPPQFVSKPQGFCVCIQLDDPSEAERVFHGLARDGTTQMPIAQTFWAQRFGMCIDKFGTPWMVNCEKRHT